MYRLVTLAVLRAGLDPDRRAAVAELLSGSTSTARPILPTQRHRLAGEDVTAEIRGRQVTPR